MATNVYFNPKVKTEQNLYEDIIIESIKMYGQDVYYLPREIVTRDYILGEDVESQFDDAYIVEMYIENTEGFEGEGNIFQKFGMEIRDEVTFVVAKRQWEKRVGLFESGDGLFRPAEGDLIYLPLSRSFFEIAFVEHEQPFYQLSNLPMYKLQARMFEFSGEDFNTKVAEIDAIEVQHAYTQILTIQDINGDFINGDRVQQVLTFDSNNNPQAIISGKVVSFQEVTPTSGQLFLVDIETNDGEFHEFVTHEAADTARRITGTGVYGRVVEVFDVATSSANNVFSTDPTASNFEFEDLGDDILDFSEANPFGDPS